MVVSAFHTNTDRAGLEARPLQVCKLGTVSYEEAWDLQRRLTEARRINAIPDALLLLEHPHVYTLGRRGSADNVLLSEEELDRLGARVLRVDRGGDVTYHGPGQLVGYPILRLPAERLDYVRYIRDVEKAMLLASRDLGAPAHLSDGLSGVWVGAEKVCAIGVKIDAYGVTSHGFALNVNVDLEYFQHIIPCGIAGKGVTSLQRLFSHRVSMARVEKTVIRRVAEAFNLAVAPRSIGRRSLERILAS